MGVTVVPDASVAPFGEGIWTVDGPQALDMGLTFTTRMAIIKAPGDGLWICDPVSVNDATRAQIDALGPVECLVTSTQRHIWRLETWHQMYPKAKLWTCGNVPKRLRTLPYDGVVGDEPLWDGIQQVKFGGNRLLAEAWFFHEESRTLIVGDLLQANLPLPGHPISNLVFRLAGGAGPSAQVGRDLKMTFTDKAAARRSLARVMDWDFNRLILAHGPLVTDDAKTHLASAFTWLTSQEHASPTQ
ncbi:MAG: hypothetical protein FWF36_09935 [Propionibacteriaceae bacterium]|nr:hypothetical protein [Propionibacteriaceae bacterium]